MPLDSHLPSPLGSLSRTATGAMLEALELYLADSDDVSALREALHTIGREARVKRIQPEQLMIALKSLWSSLTSARHASDAAQRARMLERLVTICIEEYFRD